MPAQSLTLLNDPFVRQQAEEWARRLLARPGLDPEHKIRHMMMRAFSRPPTPEEVTDGLAFLRQQSAGYGLGNEQWTSDLRVWTDYAHTLFNMKAFIFLL